MVNAIAETGKPVEIIHIQKLGGRVVQFRQAECCTETCSKYFAATEEAVDINNVVMSIKCGASDNLGMASTV